MKRVALLALAAALVVSCEKPTGPTASGSFTTMPSPTPTTFSGQATVLQAQVLNLAPIRLGDTGPLPQSGGSLESSLLTVSVSKDQTGGLLAADVTVVHAAAVGQGSASRSEAAVADVSLDVAGTPVQAEFLGSRAQATCDGSGNAAAAGNSEIVGLVVGGQTIVVSGAPNQTVQLPGLTVVINEQSQSVSGNRADITVSALHVTASDPLTGAQLADVRISTSHADITCAGCTDQGGDFVTGGGWIAGPSGAKANFAVAGGIKNGALWGHLTYIDHGPNGPKVKGTGVTNYMVTGPVSRHIEGTADIDGTPGRYAVDVTDAGEPGRNDTFSIKLSTGYAAAGNLSGGNIQLHLQPSPCP